jgi:hypothetical protein
MDLYRAECFKNAFIKPVSHNLLETPFNHHPLLVKCTHTGVTVLKDDGFFKKRVGGSQSYEVTPNALLVPKSKLNNRGNLSDVDEFIEKATPRTRYKSPEQEHYERQEEKVREYRVNKKLIRQRVYGYMLGMAKPVLHAVTISFPPCVTDDLGYQALNTWLTVSRQSLHLRDYLWVAERQPTTGTIHYHSLIPQYFNIMKANRAMAVILQNMVRKGELKWSIQAAAKYNGVDIGKNRKTKRVTNFAAGSSRKALSNYITKYISKNDEPFAHYAWHNSRGFSAIMTSICLTEAEAKYLGLRGFLNMEKVYSGEYAYWFAWQHEPPAFFSRALGLLNFNILNKGPTLENGRISFLLN